MNKVKVYIAGPINSSGKMQENIRNALEAGIRLRKAGFVVFIPHLFFFWDLMFPQDREFWMTLDKDWLKECDVMLRLPGYSEGVDEEFCFAMEHKINVYDDMNLLIYDFEIESRE
jgi:hypothetical protein